MAHPLRLNPALLRLGDEGQDWRLMPLPVFIAHPRVIPPLKTRLAAAI
jgi:8-oxo-dGTP diphosphatase